MGKKKTANSTTKGTKNAKDGKEKEGVCTMCGAVGTTVSLSTPGAKGTPPVCSNCFAKVTSQIEKTAETAVHGATSAPENREITKVRMKGKEISIAYDQPHGADKLSVLVESEDEPKQSFRDALKALVPHAVAMCDLPTAWENGCVARSVSVKHQEDGRVGAVISLVKTLDSGACCCLNTPYLPAEAENGAHMSDEAGQAVGKVMSEALKYVEGKRAQGTLFKLPDKAEG